MEFFFKKKILLLKAVNCSIKILMWTPMINFYSPLYGIKCNSYHLTHFCWFVLEEIILYGSNTFLSLILPAQSTEWLLVRRGEKKKKPIEGFCIISYQWRQTTGLGVESLAERWLERCNYDRTSYSTDVICSIKYELEVTLKLLKTVSDNIKRQLNSCGI